jgi:hypothetical protein
MTNGSSPRIMVCSSNAGALCLRFLKAAKPMREEGVGRHAAIYWILFAPLRLWAKQMARHTGAKSRGGVFACYRFLFIDIWLQFAVNSMRGRYMDHHGG